MARKTEDEKPRPIIIKRIKKGGAGHHGGAWKVAYADFVTAMMAFFLLLWLLNVTTEEQKFAISNYFDPTFPKVSSAQSGAGGVMGGTTTSPDGAKTSEKIPITTPPVQERKKMGGTDETTAILKPDISQEDAERVIRKVEEEKFKQVENQIRQALEADENLKALTNNLIMDITDEGLRIQIVDQDKTAMFPSGSAQMYTKTKQLLALVARAIAGLPNKLSIRGHTDSSPYAAGNTYDNWELSADRGNASRRALLAGGLKPARIANVQGKADTDHLDKANPMAPLNRRISLVLLRRKPNAKEVEKLRQVLEYKRRSSATSAPDRYERKESDIPFRSGGGVLGIP